MGKAKIEIDKELENRIKKMHSAGMKMTKISKETGVSYHVVARILKTGKIDNLTFFRVPENKRLIAKPLTKEEVESLRDMHNNLGWSMRKISKITGISYSRVRYAVDDEYRKNMREKCREYSKKILSIDNVDIMRENTNLVKKSLGRRSRMANVSEEQYAGYYVQPLEQKKALEILYDEVKNGGDPSKITGISDKYYLEKVMSGLCQMSALVYYRICMEKPLPKKEREKVHCLRCGAEIRDSFIYCSSCRNDIKLDRHKKNMDMGFARFGVGRKTPKKMTEY